MLRAVAVFLLFACALAQDQLGHHGKKTLVVLGDDVDKNDYSIFFGELEKKGYILTFKDSTKSLKTIRGDYKYDNMIIFSPRTTDVTQSVEFTESGRNTLIAANTHSSVVLSELFEQYGVKLETQKSAVDHFNYHKTLGKDHMAFYAKRYSEQTTIPLFAFKRSKDILYRGTILQKQNPSNPMLLSLLTGSHTAAVVSDDERNNEWKRNDDKENKINETVDLMFAHQSRSGARTALSGSVEMFSNGFLSVREVDNSVFVSDLIDWVFGGNGEIRIKELKYYKIGGQKTDEVTHYDVTLEEYDVINDAWKPLTVSDVTIEFIKLYPLISESLQSYGNGRYGCDVHIPDVHGVYTMRLSLHRVGYTRIEKEHQLTVRHLRMDQHERFMKADFPYYLTSLCTLFATVVFAVMFMCTK